MRPFGDLAVAVGLAGVGAAVAWLPADLLPGVLRAAVAAPLVLILPGYALTEALFPTSPGRPEWLLLTVGLSLAVAALGGLLLNITPWGLTSFSWAGLLLGVTLLGSLVALVRRGGVTSTRTPPWPVISRSQGLALGGAAIVTSAALLIAHQPVPEQAAQGYTLLWTLPADQAASTNIRVGIRNFEPVATAYDLRIVADGETLQDVRLDLQPVDGWEADISLPPANLGRVEALLYRADAPDVVYRRTVLRARG